MMENSREQCLVSRQLLSVVPTPVDNGGIASSEVQPGCSTDGVNSFLAQTTAAGKQLVA